MIFILVNIKNGTTTRRVLQVVGRTGLAPSSRVFVESNDAFRKFLIWSIEKSVL